MKDLLARYDALRNLDDAAEQMEREAREELELQLLTAHVLERLRGEQNAEPSTVGTVAKTIEALRQPDMQRLIRTRMGKLQRDLLKLEPTLGGDELLRARQVLSLAAEYALDDKFGESIAKLRNYEKRETPTQISELAGALEGERKLVDELRQLATAAHTRTDELSALHELRVRIERAIEMQESLQKATEQRLIEKPAAEQKAVQRREAEVQADRERVEAHERALREEAKVAETDDRAAKRMTARRVFAEKADKRQREAQQVEQRRQEAQTAREVREAADDQARLEFDVDTTSALAKPMVEKLAERVAEASERMQHAEQALRRDQPQAAAQEQAAALKDLQTAREELARHIAEAELRRDDPLAAMQRLAESLDKLVTEQKEERAILAQMNENKIAPRIVKLAGKERELAQRART